MQITDVLVHVHISNIKKYNKRAMLTISKSSMQQLNLQIKLVFSTLLQFYHACTLRYNL